MYVSWQNGCGRCEKDDHVSRLVVLLVGLVLLLAGCISASTPDSTSGPLVVIGTSPTPTRTTTTTTTEPPIDPTQCSAIDLNGEVEEYLGAYDGLPKPVEATRKAIIEAALSCDFDTLMTIDVPHVEQGTWSEDRLSIFGGVTTDFDVFVAYDQQHSALRKLVMALSSVPVERVENETRDRVPVNGYGWPLHPRLYDADTETMQSLDEVWDDDVIERVAALNDISADELVAAVDESAPFTSFTVIILDDGSWMFAGGSE
jgi:hypothetical protein